MKLSSAQNKAIGWYAQSIDAVPQLSSWPNYYFKKRSNGEIEKIHIDKLTIMYKETMKDEAKERARAKKQREKMQRM